MEECENEKCYLSFNYFLICDQDSFVVVNANLEPLQIHQIYYFEENWRHKESNWKKIA